MKLSEMLIRKLEFASSTETSQTVKPSPSGLHTNWAWRPLRPNQVNHSTSESLALLQVGLRLNYPIWQLLTFLSERLLNIETIITPSITNVEEAFDSRRRQYHSTRIIVILENHPNLSRLDRKLGVTCLDLYNPGRDGHGFIFGEARSPGPSGVVSTFRLTSSQPSLFNSRVKKEVVHELGHMLGLEHCADSQCVMHQSEIASDIDTKSDDYCNRCRRNMGKFGS